MRKVYSAFTQPKYFVSRRNSIFDDEPIEIPDPLELAKQHAAQSGLQYPSITPKSPSSKVRLHDSDIMTTEAKEALINSIRGTIYAQAIGDAVGVHTQYCSKRMVKERYPIGMPIRLDRPVRHWQAGDWTDDTDQAMLIIDSLTANNGLVNQRDFAARLKYWCINGFTEHGDLGGFGVSNTIRAVVEHESFLERPSQAAYRIFELSNGHAAGNGALSRTSVLGLVQFRSLDQVATNSLQIAETTHADPRSQAAAIVCSTLIAQLLQQAGRRNDSPAYVPLDILINHAVDLAIEFTSLSSSWNDEHDEPDFAPWRSRTARREWAKDLRKYCSARSIDELELCSGDISFAYKSIGAGIYALRHFDQNDPSGFRRIIEQIAREGGDADANCCVAAALLGARFGYHILDPRWIAGLRHRDWLDLKVNAILNLLGLAN